ncbi:MAG: hypothetical protein LBU56_01000 [Rickettsiales bacterium]|nr:hypothetical protein [Rickettsiales bacterium]
MKGTEWTAQVLCMGPRDEKDIIEEKGNSYLFKKLVLLFLLVNEKIRYQKKWKTNLKLI